MMPKKLLFLMFGAAGRARALWHDQDHSIRRYAEWYQQVRSRVFLPEPFLSRRPEEAWG